MAMRERRNIPKILDLCDEFDVPITWATVGHLLLDACKPIGGRIHSEIPRLDPFENEFWKFSGDDWFAHDPGTDLKQDPEWYALDLVRDILGRKTRHEIGCHTFSHIDCRDGVCPPNVMEAELRECQRIANSMKIDLRTFVHPAHTVGNIATLQKEGYVSFRTDEKNTLGYPIYRGKRLWELQSTMELTHRFNWSIDYHVKRNKIIVKRAMKNHSLCLFWFHPSASDVFVEKILPELFGCLKQLGDKILLTTTGSYVDWLNVNTPKND